MKTERKMLKTSLIGIVVLFCAVAKTCPPPQCPSCWGNWPDCDVWKCTGCSSCEGTSCVDVESFGCFLVSLILGLVAFFHYLRFLKNFKAHIMIGFMIPENNVS